ncbi:MAG: hypothetical protein LBS92_05960 [Candidatus Methanoplasma sp.]|jgi:hypothetical protein|nr:hypothetical protein [Candidatus Methanoplasma sp.]
MATDSFTDMLVIDMPEKARQLASAFAITEKRGHSKPDPAILKRLAEDEEYFRSLKHEPKDK